jgi:hypothetical protein
VGADVVEQMARPDAGQAAINSAGGVLTEIVNKKIPLAAPLTNEFIEVIKDSEVSKKIQEKLNAVTESDK